MEYRILLAHCLQKYKFISTMELIIFVLLHYIIPFVISFCSLLGFMFVWINTL
jgi:hypothetical protein